MARCPRCGENLESLGNGMFKCANKECSLYGIPDTYSNLKDYAKEAIKESRRIRKRSYHAGRIPPLIEAYEKEPYDGKPERERDYHIVRSRFPWRRRRCPTCNQPSMAERVDERTGTIYFECTNPDCPDRGRRFTPGDAGIRGRRMPLFGWGARQRASKRKIYSDRINELRRRYRRGEITRDEYIRERGSIRNEIYGGGGPARGFVTGIGGRMDSFARRVGPDVARGLGAAAIIGIGAIVSISLGNYYFFFAFLSWAVHFLTPEPSSGEWEKNIPMGWGHILPWEHGGSHAGYAWIKSITKISAIILVALGFRSLGDAFNALFIITCIAGYFMMRITYNPRMPGEFIESLVRFGVLGCYFIPLWVFGSVFESYVLAAMAFAFFAIPPMPDTTAGNVAEVLARGLSGQTAYFEMFDKILFLGLMLFALIGSGSFPGLGFVGWELTGVLKYTFIYFWLIAAIGGFFSPARERPYTGILMLGGATVIYGIGPGSQQIGSAILGQWWPTVHNTFSTVTEPIASLMGSLGNTLSQGFFLLTNPVGYATQLMNGTYADNPSGRTGSFGLEMDSMSITNIFPEQPFVVTAILRNTGAFEARNVVVGISALSPDIFGTSGTARGSNYITGSVNVLDIGKLGFAKGSSGACDEIATANRYSQRTSECVKYYGGEPVNVLGKMMVWQAAFHSTGISCSDIVSMSLRKKYIPITARVEYDYQSDSRVEVDFISESEWNRLSQSGKLDSIFRNIESQYSSAPVRFPIGTAGLKNPILETQPFHVSMMIDSADGNKGEIIDLRNVSLTVPGDWEFRQGTYKNSCSPEPNGYRTEGGSKIIRWDYTRDSSARPGAASFICYFRALKSESGDAMGGVPTKSYTITAHADYRFSAWKEVDTKIEFGGFCCPDSPGCEENCPSEDCASAQVCTNNACVSTGTSVPVNYPSDPGGIHFCNAKLNGKAEGYDKGPCLLGMGGCTSDSECSGSTSYQDCTSQNRPYTYPLKCMSVSGIPNRICCSEAFTEKQCVALHNKWLGINRPLADQEIGAICNDPSLK